MAVVLDQSIPDERVRAAILSHWSETELQTLTAECRELGAAPDQLYLNELRKRYDYVRQFAPVMLEKFDLQAVSKNQPRRLCALFLITSKIGCGVPPRRHGAIFTTLPARLRIGAECTGSLKL